MNDYDIVAKISIIPRGPAGGVTIFMPSEERLNSGKEGFPQVPISKTPPGKIWKIVFLGLRGATCYRISTVWSWIPMWKTLPEFRYVTCCRDDSSFPPSTKSITSFFVGGQDSIRRSSWRTVCVLPLVAVWLKRSSMDERMWPPEPPTISSSVTWPGGLFIAWPLVCMS